MSDLFRGFDLSRVADEVARKTYERDAKLTAEKVPWDDLDPMLKHTLKSGLLPIINDVLDSLQANRPRPPKPMERYGYGASEERMDPRWYENQPDQLEIATATTWALHLHVSQELVPPILDCLKDHCSVTGEYVNGDSWTEWGEKSNGPDDNHLTIYFRAPTPKAAALEADLLIASAEVTSMRARRGGTFALTKLDYAISTAGDWSEQLKES